MSSRQRKRAYVFTINNYTGEDVALVDAMPSTYVVYGYEVGQEGTPHLQGYVEFRNPRDFEAVCAMLPRAHLEGRRGTPFQASQYCKKGGDYCEHGTISHQGKSNHLTSAIEAVMTEEASLSTIMNEHPVAFVQYERGLSKLVQSRIQHRTEPPVVVWLYGPTGVGKSREAIGTLPMEQVYIKNNNKWWDGYCQQQRIVIDDFEPQEWSFRTLLRLLDRYPFTGETKGGHVVVNSSEIYVTCEYAPSELYPEPKKYAQLMRRITELRKLE